SAVSPLISAFGIEKLFPLILMFVPRPNDIGEPVSIT
ncbi:unnamed protein product, partial [Adineta steineri]